MTNSPNVPLAVSLGAATLAWYAMPDLVRSRTARTVLKAALLAGGGVAWKLLAPPAEAQHGPDVFDEVLSAINGEPARALGVGAAAVGLTTAVTVWAEKAIFHFGERRRARGESFAHTLPAIGLAVLGGAATLPLPGWAGRAMAGSGAVSTAVPGNRSATAG